MFPSFIFSFHKIYEHIARTHSSRNQIIYTHSVAGPNLTISSAEFCFFCFVAFLNLLGLKYDSFAFDFKNKNVPFFLLLIPLAFNACRCTVANCTIESSAYCVNWKGHCRYCNVSDYVCVS